MKTLLTILALIAFTFTSSAQEWLTDMDQAQAIAKKTDKAIVLVFQGSDWCAPCIRLDKEIFQSESFKLYAKDHFVMVKADFPRKKVNKLNDEQTAHNEALAEEYNKRGIFPLVVVMDQFGKVLGENGYHKTSPNKYILELEAFASEK
ncbi:MAG: thioredoxin family protein [Patiriisocius sp.]|uniref:thioredoxin family protein n=1 Tax=Patiriisocius sp. TaxID=2822396 RepID=UPI003EF96648